jgi:hypothetical protein
MYYEEIFHRSKVYLYYRLYSIGENRRSSIEDKTTPAHPRYQIKPDNFELTQEMIDA